MSGEGAATMNKAAQDKTQAVQVFAAQNGRGLQQTDQVCWDTLAAGGTKEPGAPRLDLDFREEFNRDDLEEQLVAAMANPTRSYQGVTTTIADVISNRSQAHWLASVERDFLMRRRSRIRAEAHAAATRVGIGSDNGPVGKGIRRYLKQLAAVAAFSHTRATRMA